MVGDSTGPRWHTYQTPSAEVPNIVYLLAVGLFSFWVGGCKQRVDPLALPLRSCGCESSDGSG